MKKIAAAFLSLFIAGSSIQTVYQSISPDLITASAESSLSESAQTSSAVGIVETSGAISKNISANRYKGNTAATVKSYLHFTDSGDMERIEYIEPDIVIERYSPDGRELLSSQKLELPMPIYGGVFTGKKYNYVVSGCENMEESDDNPVITVEQYTKDWEFINEDVLYGINTKTPFRAGVVRMTEDEDHLYIHTCHTIYEIEGINHQTNMSFVYNQEGLELTESHHQVAGNRFGYVSHSFNQYITNDENYIFCADHGDAHPRAVTIARSNLNKPFNSKATDIYPIIGDTGDNYTGVEVGGFELSENNCLTAIASVKMDSNFKSTARKNIFLLVTDKALTSTRTAQITDLGNIMNAVAYNPQLVKINNDAFLLMWEETDETSSLSVKAVTIDGDGDLTSEITALPARLSDCQPVVDSNGLVRWYATNASSPVFYTVDPCDLGSFSAAFEEIKWEYDDETATLTVYGNAFMNEKKQPWSEYSKTAKHLVIRDGVKNIADGAFEDFIALESVEMADSITSIGENAFNYCKSLKNVKLSSGIKELPIRCFAATGLRSITIPENITKISSYAFEHCRSLKSLYLPSTLTFIDDYTTFNCVSLTDVWFNGSPSAWAQVTIVEYCNDPLLNATVHTLDEPETTTSTTTTATTTTTKKPTTTSTTTKKPKTTTTSASTTSTESSAPEYTVKVNIVDEETGKQLEGVEYHIEGLGDNGAFFGSEKYISGSEPEVINVNWHDMDDLSEVFWRLGINEVPIGYLIPIENTKDWMFVDSKSAEITVEIPRSPDMSKLTFEINLCDSNTHKPIPGIKFTISGKEGKTDLGSKSYVSGDELNVIDLSWDDITDARKTYWTFTITSVPEGYSMPEDPDVVFVFQRNNTVSTERIIPSELKDEIVIGDANCDSQVNMADAVYIMQCISNPDKYQLTETGRANADTDGSGDITNKDALMIQQFKLGLIKELSIK